MVSNEQQIISELRDIKKVLQEQIKLLNNIYRIFSKYDEQYLTELEQDGIKPPQENFNM